MPQPLQLKSAPAARAKAGGTSRVIEFRSLVILVCGLGSALIGHSALGQTVPSGEATAQPTTELGSWEASLLSAARTFSGATRPPDSETLDTGCDATAAGTARRSSRCGGETASGVPAGTAEKSLAEIEVPKSKLQALFAGKSWLWSDGAGYFSSDGRFAAWSGNSENASSAGGRWTLADDGTLCVRAIWCSSSGQAQTSMCFSHRASGSVIYQRKLPSGHWYTFADEDKVAKAESLVSGDVVSAKIAQFQTDWQAKNCALPAAPLASKWSTPPFRGSLDAAAAGGATRSQAQVNQDHPAGEAVSLVGGDRAVKSARLSLQPTPP